MQHCQVKLDGGLGVAEAEAGEDAVDGEPAWVTAERLVVCRGRGSCLGRVCSLESVGC